MSHHGVLTSADLSSPSSRPALSSAGSMARRHARLVPGRRCMYHPCPDHPNRLLQHVSSSLTGCFQNVWEHQAAAAVAAAVEAAIVLHARIPSHLARHPSLLYYSLPEFFEQSAPNGNVWHQQNPSSLGTSTRQCRSWRAGCVRQDAAWNEVLSARHVGGEWSMEVEICSSCIIKQVNFADYCSLFGRIWHRQSREAAPTLCMLCWTMGVRPSSSAIHTSLAYISFRFFQATKTIFFCIHHAVRHLHRPRHLRALDGATQVRPESCYTRPSGC